MQSLKKLVTIVYLLVFFVACNEAYCDEPIYPAGYNILCQRSVSQSVFSTLDTLVVTGSIVNNESFSLSGLYFSENLPDDFMIAAQAVAINGYQAEYEFSGPLGDYIFPGWNTYYWILGDPSNGGAYNVEVKPGEDAVFTIKLICSQPGQYSFPLHTVSFYGDQRGFFSTSEPISIEVLPSGVCGDADGNGSVGLPDIIILINFIYKGGVPPVPYAVGDINGSGFINLLDITCIISYIYKNGPEPLCSGN
jgi:hypothetical protein